MAGGRVAMLALDAADASVMAELASRGHAPTFQRMLEHWWRVAIDTPVGLYVGAVWPTILTGSSPAAHGLYSYQQLVPGTYRTVRPDETTLLVPPFWDHVGRAGRRVAIVDAPHIPVGQGLNGVHVVEWGAHDAHHGFATWPAELAEEITTSVGPHPVPPRCNAHRRTAEDYARFRDQLSGGVAAKTRLLLDLLGREQWDLFLAVFSESHCGGHQCWHLHDPAHPRHEAELAATVGDVLAQTYEALDTALGEVLDGIDADTTVFVLLSHGMGPHYDGTHLLDRFLRRLERVDRLAPWRGVLTGVEHAWDVVPWRVRERLTTRWDRTWRGGYRNLLPRNPARRPWFTIVNNDAHSGIRLNIRGREPDGVVAPEEVAALTAALVEEIRALRNADTGGPVVDRIVIVDEEYSGPARERLPDVAVEWARDAPINRVWSPRVGTVTSRWTDARTGDHRPQGMLLVRTPSGDAGELPRARADQIAPTIAAVLGVPLPGAQPAIAIPAGAPARARAHR